MHAEREKRTTKHGTFPPTHTHHSIHFLSKHIIHLNMKACYSSDTPATTTYDWDPSQAVVIADVVPSGVIMIEAVPGAGKTQLLIEKCFESDHSLVISLTNAVRTEIANRIKETFRLRGEDNFYTYEKTAGNHDVFIYDDGQPGGADCVVHVATLDSWVHECIRELTEEEPTEAATVSQSDAAAAADTAALPADNDHELKKRFLFERYLSRGVLPTCGLLDYTQIIVDEMQDLDDSFYQILVLIAKLAMDPSRGMRLILAGDPNQNVFGRADYCIMKAFAADMHAKQTEEQGSSSSSSSSSSSNATTPVVPAAFREYLLDYNHRCPPRHLDFVNKLFRMIGRSRKIRWPVAKPAGYKPVLVKTNHGNNANSVMKRAETIVKYIDMLLKGDDRQTRPRCSNKQPYTFGDIALLSPRNYSNNLFGVLEGMLRARYGPDKVAWIYSSSADAGTDDAVDKGIGITSGSAWEDVGDAIVLSSIHNNKGKTHRVVFACDCFTDGLMPRNYADSPIEVESQLCQLNVALTRATERLYIFYNDPVSRFVGGEAGLASLSKYAFFHVSETCEKWARLAAANVEPPPPFNALNVMENMNSSTLPRSVTSAIRYCYDKGLLSSVDIATSAYRAFLAATGGRAKFLCSTSSSCVPSQATLSDEAPSLTWSEAIAKERVANEYFTYLRLFMRHVVLGIPLPSSVTKFKKILIVPTRLNSAVYMFNRIAAAWSASFRNRLPSCAWVSCLDETVRNVADKDPSSNRSLLDTYKSKKKDLIEFLEEEGIVCTSGVQIDPACVILLKANEASKMHALLSASVTQLEGFLLQSKRNKEEFPRKHLTDLWNIAVALVNFPGGVCNKRIHTETFINAPPFALGSPEMNVIYNECYEVQRMFEESIRSSSSMSNDFVSKIEYRGEDIGGPLTFPCCVNGGGGGNDVEGTVSFFNVSVDAVAVARDGGGLGKRARTALVPIVINFALPNAPETSSCSEIDCVPNRGLSGGNPLQETLPGGGPSYKDIFQSLLFCWSAAGLDCPPDQQQQLQLSESVDILSAHIWKIGNVQQPSRLFSTGNVVACAEGAKDEFSRLMSTAMQRVSARQQQQQQHQQQ